MTFGLRARVASLFGMLGGLAACDDAWTITRVDNQIRDTHSYVAPLAAGGLATEIHGLPFEGLTPGEIVAALKLPATWPTDIRFRVTDTPGEGGRLVLHFNPQGAPNGYVLCAPRRPPAAGPPRGEGFSVTATLCNGERLLTTGHMEAPKIRPDDRQGFARAMTALLRETFGR
jgi:hypothetical protein